MKKIILTLTTIFAVTILMSCATIKEIPEDKTSAQIIQMGQNYVSGSDYDSALVCYEAALDRFGTDPKVYSEAKYEVGHVYLKQKKYDKAYQTFTELIDLYEHNSTVMSPTYKKLAEIGISQIPEKKLSELTQQTE